MNHTHDTALIFYTNMKISNRTHDNDHDEHCDWVWGWVRLRSIAERSVYSYGLTQRFAPRSPFAKYDIFLLMGFEEKGTRRVL